MIYLLEILGHMWGEYCYMFLSTSSSLFSFSFILSCSLYHRELRGKTEKKKKPTYFIEYDNKINALSLDIQVICCELARR